MSEIKWMDLDEFLNEGFLQEANRQFFHPLGLALAVTCDDTGKVTDIAGLWDYRDDPEGVIFGEVDANKAETVERQRLVHWSIRSDMFGRRGHARVTTVADVQPLDWKPDDGPPRDE